MMNNIKTYISKIVLYLKPIFSKSVENTKSLLIIMIPIIFVIKILQELNLINYLMYPFAPLMELMGLPSVYALAWIGAILNNNYTAFSVIIMLFQSNPITYEQITVLSLVCLLCHSMVIETVIASKLGVRASWSIFIRFVSAIVCGFTLHLICSKLNIMQDIVNNPVINNPIASTITLADISFAINAEWVYSQIGWLLEQAKTIILIFVIIFSVF